VNQQPTWKIPSLIYNHNQTKTKNIKIQQQLQPVNNLTGNVVQCKPKIQVETQIENLVVAQGSPTTTTRQEIKQKKPIIQNESLLSILLIFVH
jgi:hypothetical protein